MRDPFLTCLFLTNDLEGATALLSQFSDDIGAHHDYGLALCLFKKHGETSVDARLKLQAAIKENEFVPRYLLGKSILPLETPETYQMGGEDEAMIYVEDAAETWKTTPGALDWLEQVVRLL